MLRDLGTNYKKKSSNVNMKVNTMSVVMHESLNLNTNKYVRTLNTEINILW